VRGSAVESCAGKFSFIFAAFSSGLLPPACQLLLLATPCSYRVAHIGLMPSLLTAGVEEPQRFQI
jgi:hypothetical protein